MERVERNGWGTAADAGLVVLRAALAVIFLAHGTQKLFGWFGGHGLAATLEQFQQGMGIPPFLGAVAVFTEVFGALAVLFGVLTRTASVGLAITMVVAFALVHGKNGFFVNWAQKPGVEHGYEYNLALGAMALALALTGPGRWALAGDTERRLLERFASRGEGSAPAPRRDRAIS